MSSKYVVSSKNKILFKTNIKLVALLLSLVVRPFFSIVTVIKVEDIVMAHIRNTIY